MTGNTIHDAWRSVWRRRDLRPIPDWAIESTDLKAPLTITGPFDVSRSRHFILPLAGLQDDYVREENILKPVRSGGTLIADVFVSWTRPNDPGPTMFVLQTDPIADDHFTKILLPMMESVPAIKSELDALDRFQKTSRKIEFSDGNHLHVNGPSIGNLQTNAFRYIVEDECWLYPDKMADAEGRAGDFQRIGTSKILRVSQGGPKDGIELDHCAWVRAYHRGCIHEWEVACPQCGKYYDPIFSGQREDGSFYGITWDKLKLANGDWDIAKCAATVRFECPHCAGPVLDTPRTKGEWNRTGRYRLTTEENRKRKSFHWEAVIDFPWDELVVLWLDACNAELRGDLRPKIQFYQKRRAMHKDEASLLRGGLHFSRRVYEINSDWPEEKARFLTLDRQEEDLFWWSVRQWSLDKSRRLGFGKAYGFAECERIREKYKVPPNHVFCDSGFLPKGDHGVYTACLRFKWIALKGDDKFSFTHRTRDGRSIQKCYAPLTWADPGSGTAQEGRRRCPLILFSKYQMNQQVKRLVESGAWLEPQTCEDPEMEKEYAAQMASRIKKSEYNPKSGQTKVWFKEGKNDHACDLANMQVLGAVMENCVPDPAMERLSESETKEPESA
jgi:hypothetical protein